MASETSNPIGTSSFALRKLVHEAKSKPTDESLHDQTFIVNPNKVDTHILGPAFFDLPLKFTPCYPILEECQLIKDQALDFIEWSTKNFVCWPVQDKDWGKWTEHMLKYKKTELEQTGLWHIITLLRYGIQQNPALIHAALAFWDPSFNYFRFNCGMMGPTVLDVSFLTGLPPFGPMFDISKSIDVPPLKDMKTSGSYASYGNFFRSEAKFEDPVSDMEFFAYLLYTLCKMVFCHSGKKIMHEFAPLAYCLSKGEKFDLASYFLGYVYKIGSDSQSKPLMYNIGGPLWFLQLWIVAYFPVFKVAISEPVNVYGDKFKVLASNPLSLVGYLQYFFQMREDKEEAEFRPFTDWSIGPSWLKDMMENRDSKSFADAWGSILLPREIFIGGIIGGCKQTHAETYCPAQFARQFGMVQAIPCPFPGDTNVPLYDRKKVDKNHLSRINVEFRRFSKAFIPLKFAIDSPIFTGFSQWWHNLIELYNQTASVQKFASHIGCSAMIGGEAPSNSLSVSDDGFGVQKKNKTQEEEEKEISEVQSSALVSVALNIKPLQSVPQMMTRSQRHKNTPSPPSGNKRKGDVEQETIHEKAKFTKVYGASKRRKKILIEEPEEDETEDIPMSKFVKVKKTTSGHIRASKSDTVVIHETTSTTIGKITKGKILKFPPQVIIQDMSPPVISTIARALASESIRKGQTEESISNVADLTAGSSTPGMITKENIPEEPLDKGLLQEYVSLNVEVSDQDQLNQSISKMNSENLSDIETAKTTEADIHIQHVISVPKDDRSLFPEIALNTFTIKTSDPVEVVIEKAILGQSPRIDIPVQRTPLEQIHPIEKTDASSSTTVGDLSLEQFKLRVNDFCQRITNPKAPILSSESPIIQLKTQHSSSLPELVKPTFTPGEIQELKEILQQFSILDFEKLAEGDLKMQLET